MAKTKKTADALLDIFTPKGKSTLPDSTIQQIEDIVTQGALPVEPKVTAAERAAAGRAAAKLIESQKQLPMSEALGNLNVEGFGKLSTTQADRTRVGGGNIGGAGFPAISEADPNYKGKSWGVMDYGTASRLTNLTSPETIWTTMLGSATQLKTNPVVFAKLEKQFKDSMKAGNLTPELEKKINQNLRLFMGEDANIRDPKIWKDLDTFEKRSMMADLMMGQGLPPQKGGIALGGEKSGKGVIFKPTETLIRETEPSLLHPEHGGEASTFSLGPRLFTMEKEVSYRPDLHPGFPTLIQGEDLGYNVRPVPNEIALPDWHKRFITLNPDRKPGYYDLALGIKGEGLPSQLIDQAYLTRLQKEGFADGGMVETPTQEAIANTVQNPNAARMLDMDLANLALMNQPQRMAKGGKPVGDQRLFDLKRPPEPVPPTLREVMAEIGRDPEKYNAQFPPREFGQNTLEAYRLMQAAKETGNPERYLESLNPYFDSQVKFDIGSSPFAGYVDKDKPNLAVMAQLTDIENTIPHELTHTLQLQRGKGLDYDDMDILLRGVRLPEEMRQKIFSAKNSFANPMEAYANAAAYAHLVNAAGGDFVNTPEGKALLPDRNAQSDYYLKTMPGVDSAFGYRENQGEPPKVKKVDSRQSYARQAMQRLGFAGGGQVPSPEEMLIEMMERGYGKN